MNPMTGKLVCYQFNIYQFLCLLFLVTLVRAFPSKAQHVLKQY